MGEPAEVNWGWHNDGGRSGGLEEWWNKRLNMTMTKWQHMMETYPQDRLIEMLNQRGDEGWELACVNWDGDRAEVFYKRRMDEPKAP